MTWYITISSAGYLDCLEAVEIVRFLKSELNLSMEEASFNFVNQDSVNPVSIIIAKADMQGCYSLVDRLPELINIIELIYWNDKSSTFYEGIASKIASHFNWIARIENSDEERLIYPIKSI